MPRGEPGARRGNRFQADRPLLAGDFRKSGDLIDEFATPSKSSGKPARYSLNNIRVEGGQIDLIDQTKHARHVVRALRFAVPFFSNLPYDVEQYVQPAFSAQINGTTLDLRPEPRRLLRRSSLRRSPSLPRRSPSRRLQTKTSPAG